MAAASVVQGWTREQEQPSSRITSGRVSFSHGYSYYNKTEYNNKQYSFSRNKNGGIHNRSKDSYMVRSLPRIDPRSASAINMNNIYIQHHRPYASVISPGYLRQELKRSIHSREHPLLSPRSLHQVHRRSSEKHILDKRLRIASNNRSNGYLFPDSTISSVYNTNSHVSNIPFQTENTRILQYKMTSKPSANVETDSSISLANDDKNAESRLFIEEIEPNVNNDISKIKNVEIEAVPELNESSFISNTEQNVIQNEHSSNPKLFVPFEKTKSFKSKILKVLSFTSLSSLETINTNNVQHTKNHTYSQNISNDTAQIDDITTNSEIYSFSKKLTSPDSISITSTASSASFILRKISKEGKGMLKKSKKTLSNIFKGSLHFEDSKIAMSKEYKKSMIEEISKNNLGTKNSINSFHNNLESSGSIEKDENNLLKLNNHVQEQKKDRHIEDTLTSQPTCENTSISIASINDPTKEKKNDQSTCFKPCPPTKKGILKYADWSSTIPNLKPSHSLTDIPIQFSPPIPLELVTFDDVPNTLSSTETSITKSTKSLSFSPKITIYDTWPSFEYDRRGEIATCNRLTPILAQRIKEELNTYKLDEMIVHEQSRRFTHFFN
ncbi:hypothetical protein T552_02667 [Pneumocystis carinii B80]|uniref:Protein BNI4 n=1 Tax=Pneumocystis carinii (strain B80) TaxID=1408658 RepID=A0A0W4ZE67_PNEC8|nr:hypothetical protein T552_02667 [Pneumocystis carinii B80]KTW26658.1 hypothetical protein T552_02667 [Pneumocystis carinii B80]